MDTTTESNGTIMRRIHGHLHSTNDMPSVEYPSGRREWHSNGVLHRGEDKPAVDKPAVEGSDGLKIWYAGGNIHRDGDKPSIIRGDGSKEWYRNGAPHRNGDKPAIERASGLREWYRNGHLHRDNYLPARIHPDGTEEYYVNGIQYWPGESQVGKQACHTSTPHEPVAMVAVDQPTSGSDMRLVEIAEKKANMMRTKLTSIKALLKEKSAAVLAEKEASERLTQLAAEVATAQKDREYAATKITLTETEINQLLEDCE